MPCGSPEVSLGLFWSFLCTSTVCKLHISFQKLVWNPPTAQILTIWVCCNIPFQTFSPEILEAFWGSWFIEISVGDPVDFLAGSWIPDPGSDSLKIRVNPWSRLPDPDLSDFGRILGAESRIRIPTINSSGRYGVIPGELTHQKMYSLLTYGYRETKSIFVLQLKLTCFKNGYLFCLSSFCRNFFLAENII